MFNNIVNSIRIFLTSPEDRLERKAKLLARQTTQNFDQLQIIIKEGEAVLTDKQNAQEDQEQFLQNNDRSMVDQNVDRNTDNARAAKLLTGAMILGCLLSVKGLKFYFGEFYASISLFVVIPVALALAGLIVVGSIYLNYFSDRFLIQNPIVFFQIKAASYSMVLFIPAMNLLEGFDSDYRSAVMMLNIAVCVIDILIHTTLVSMSPVFITMEKSRKAIEILQKKAKAVAVENKNLQDFNKRFWDMRATFTAIGKQFVGCYKELETRNPEAAAAVLMLLDNFTIWMLNNKVMQHALVPYHTDANGRIVIDPSPFSPEQNSIIQSWDFFSTVRNSQAANQQGEKSESEEPDGQLTSGGGGTHPTLTSSSNEIKTQPVPTNDVPDYYTLIDNINPNDKTL